MSKNLSLKKETLVSLQTVDLDQVYGGLHKTSSAHPVAQPTATAVSSALNGGGFAHPTSTAVSSAHKPGGTVSSVRPTSTAVSSARPGGGSLSSVMPGGHKVSSALPRF
jgi:hypothetical protein